jgi:succinate dehydrogenase/fumarate reductase flavoprotein subunit
MSDNVNRRLLTAQWVLERNLGWISAAEVKVGVVITFDVAMLGGLAVAYSGATTKPAWAYLCGSVAVVALFVALGCAAAVVLPRLSGPQTSLVYFGRIAGTRCADYVETFCNATDEALLVDWVEQIHRNAEIANMKHGWVRRAVLWSFLAAVPWAASIGLLVK